MDVLRFQYSLTLCGISDRVLLLLPSPLLTRPMTSFYCLPAFSRPHTELARVSDSTEIAFVHSILKCPPLGRWITIRHLLWTNELAKGPLRLIWTSCAAGRMVLQMDRGWYCRRFFSNSLPGRQPFVERYLDSFLVIPFLESYSLCESHPSTNILSYIPSLRPPGAGICLLGVSFHPPLKQLTHYIAIVCMSHSNLNCNCYWYTWLNKWMNIAANKDKIIISTVIEMSLSDLNLGKLKSLQFL